jgi:hypothetical protein
MKLFEFIYYCLYRIIASIKRVGVRDEDVASDLYLAPLICNTLMVIFPLLRIAPKYLINESILKTISILFVASILIGWQFYCKYYFIKKENYIRIINDYQYKIKNVNALIIGILYILLSFVFFVISAKFSSNIEWHF